MQDEVKKSAQKFEDMLLNVMQEYAISKKIPGTHLEKSLALVDIMTKAVAVAITCVGISTCHPGDEIEGYFNNCIDRLVGVINETYLKAIEDMPEHERIIAEQEIKKAQLEAASGKLH